MESQRSTVELAAEPGGPALPSRVKLFPGFLIENERVLVKVQAVAGQNLHGDGLPQFNQAFWVDARLLKAEEPLILRSEMWEIADGPDREALLRSLAVVLARQDSFHLFRIDLASLVPGDVELLFYNAVEPEEAVAYLSGLAPIRLRSQPRALPWQPPTHVLSSRIAPSKERYESHVGHLPLWLESRRLWSVFLWDQGRLLHIVQFSLNQRLRQTIESRFKLRPATGDGPSV